MESQATQSKILQRQIALPSDHGSWVFLFSPLMIGIFAGGTWSIGTFLLVIALVGAFLSRQPITYLIKIFSGRRARRDLRAAWFWTGIYSFISFLALLGLILFGYTYLLVLVIPAVLVFAWHLYLVSRRAERRQLGVEIVASGVLALSAPAAYWVGIGQPDRIGWLLFLLTWMQSAGSIVYAYLRLAQRGLAKRPDLITRLNMARRALIYNSFNFLFVLLLSALQVTPQFLATPYLLQLIETVWGTYSPAIGLKPTQIGIRQLLVSTLFTILFIVTWNFISI